MLGLGLGLGLRSQGWRKGRISPIRYDVIAGVVGLGYLVAVIGVHGQVHCALQLTVDVS